MKTKSGNCVTNFEAQNIKNRQFNSSTAAEGISSITLFQQPTDISLHRLLSF